MSILISKIICSSLMSIAGIKIVKDISGSSNNLISLKTILLMLLLIIVPAFMYSTEYSSLYTIIIYAMTIYIYKEILNISLLKSILSCSFMQLALALLDVLSGAIITIFIPINEFRKMDYLNILVNIIFIVILIFLSTRKVVRNNIPSLISKLENKKATRIILAIILVIITMCIIVYTLTRQVSINNIFTTNFLLFLVFFLLLIILIGERNNYENLSDEYESLFNYVHIFEDWIEKEQLTRHEYKNQLAVLRSMTKEKKVKDKIDNVIDDFINLDGEIINQLRYLPNGGLKGLLYYKIAIANKTKVNITVDVDEFAGKNLAKIKDDKIKTLTKLVGIYTDNAIEAAIETSKKLVSVEIYMVKNNVKIVVSNSFNKKKDISNRYQKGGSTKGKGRGNGLYFAKKLISKNTWVTEKQEIIKNIYIQELFIEIKK